MEYAITPLNKINMEQKEKVYAVTGTFHGSIITANSEGEARDIFHKYYKGESILYIKDISNYQLNNF